MNDYKHERRGFARADFSFAALIEGKNDVVNGRARDISINGLFVHLENEFFASPGDLVTVTVYLDGSEQRYSIFKLDCRVVRIQEDGVGVQFRPMTLTNHKRLQAITSFVSCVDASSDDEAFLQFQLSLLNL